MAATAMAIVLLVLAIGVHASRPYPDQRVVFRWPTSLKPNNLGERQTLETGRFTQPRTTERSEPEFEMMARASAYKEAQFNRTPMHEKYENEYPKVLSDEKTTSEEMKPKSTVALVFDHVNSSGWEDGLWGTKHRPGADHSLQNVEVSQPDGTTVPQSFNNPQSKSLVFKFE